MSLIGASLIGASLIGASLIGASLIDTSLIGVFLNHRRASLICHLIGMSLIVGVHLISMPLP